MSCYHLNWSLFMRRWLRDDWVARHSWGFSSPNWMNEASDRNTGVTSMDWTTVVTRNLVEHLTGPPNSPDLYQRIPRATNRQSAHRSTISRVRSRRDAARGLRNMSSATDSRQSPVTTTTPSSAAAWTTLNSPSSIFDSPRFSFDLNHL